MEPWNLEFFLHFSFGALCSRGGEKKIVQDLPALYSCWLLMTRACDISDKQFKLDMEIILH